MGREGLVWDPDEMMLNADPPSAKLSGPLDGWCPTNGPTDTYEGGTSMTQNRDNPHSAQAAVQRELLPEHRVILSLCDHTGIWSQPYRAAGYDVRKVDIQGGEDVRLLEYPGDVHGIIAQPPCTHFAGSGARWWTDKGDEAILEGLQVVDACLRFVAVCSPQWWVLENPVGRLSDWIGPHVMTFQPHEYAGYADDPDAEGYTKRTCLWGGGDDTPPFYEVECTCGENALIACDADGCITDGTGVECPGCGHTIQVVVDDGGVWWKVNYHDIGHDDALCFHYHDDDVPDGCELLEAT